MMRNGPFNMVPIAATTTTKPPISFSIKCPIFTYSGYDASSDTFYCEYQSWAYGVFAIASILIVMVPVLTIVCFFTRYRSRKRYIRRLPSTDSYSSPIHQQLLSEETHHNDALAYEHVEAFPPPSTSEADSTSGRPSESHDNVSVVSSRASLVPNYDQSSLDSRNAKTKSAFQNCSDCPEVIERPERHAPPSDEVSPYMVCNVNPRNKETSPIDVVPEETSPKKVSLPVNEPEYAVLEKSGHSTNFVKINEDKKTVNKPTIPDDKTQAERPTSVHDSRVKSALEFLQSIVEAPYDEPESNVTPDLEDLANEDHNKEAKENIPGPGDLDNKKKPEKNLLVDDKVKQTLLDGKQKDACFSSKAEGNKDYEETDEQRYMPLVFPEPTKETINPLNQDRAKLRSDYQEILLNGVKSYPIEERNGCFVLRDSISSPGSKALIIYCKTPGNQQELYNFKVCYDDTREVYLAKSMKRFPTVEELLAFLRLNTDMLPCPLRSQIT